MTRAHGVYPSRVARALPFLTAAFVAVTVTACSASVSAGGSSTSAPASPSAGGTTKWTTAQEAEDGLKSAGIACLSPSESGTPTVSSPDPTATSGMGYVQVNCNGFYVALITDAAKAKESDKEYFCSGKVSQADLDNTVSVVGDGFSISGNVDGKYGTWPSSLQPDAFTAVLPGTATETDAAYKKRIC